MTDMKRYILIPGFVFAIDGDRHYISAPELARLYGVPTMRCKVLKTARDRRLYFDFDQRPYDVILRPQSSGDYSLPRPRGKS